MATSLEATVHQERRRSEGVFWRLLPRLAALDGEVGRPWVDGTREAAGEGSGRAVDGPSEMPPIEEIVHHPDHSNDLLEIRLGGRRLMLKRGVDPWCADRFRGARRAARLLRSRGGIAAPRYLDVPEEIDGWPILVWWRIPSPTLQRVWSGLPEGGRTDALRSWGRLLRRVHEIPVEGWGPLADVREERADATSFFRRDLGDRLRHAARGSWREAVPLVDALLERVPDVERRTEHPVLVHSDAHLSNVLCEVEGDDVHCVGMLDLEAVTGGAPEMDLSYVRLVHSPIMAGGLGHGWTDRVVDGYGEELDDELMEFFGVYHLLNIGIHAALQGWSERAEQLAEHGGRMLDGAGPT